jgi:hypothetical protein
MDTSAAIFHKKLKKPQDTHYDGRRRQDKRLPAKMPKKLPTSPERQ